MSALSKTSRATALVKSSSLCTARQTRSITDHQRRQLRRQLSEQEQQQHKAMDRNMPREWKVGDVYAPHDLSAAEARKWKKRYSPKTDAFDALDLNPLDLYKNFAVMSEYMTEMGRIRHSDSTGLRPVNQRKMAKAIRRAIGLGLMPSIHRHPEILKKEMEKESFDRPGVR